uniref:type II toxin-antitoxin system MqsA family antitoxin n=1 Tax=Massilia sp. W12 TaxID=3126507 RepID=UPI00403F2D9B
MKAGEWFGSGANAFSLYENRKSKPPLTLLKSLQLPVRRAELLQALRTMSACRHSILPLAQPLGGD